MTDPDNRPPDEEKLEITFDDLQEETAEETPPSSDASETLVVEIGSEDESAREAGLQITLDDLDDVEPVALPSVDPSKAAPTAKKPVKGMAREMSARNLIRMTLAGVIGAAVGWLLTEPIQMAWGGSDDLGMLVADAAVFSGLVGMAVGASVGIANLMSIGMLGKMARGIISGAVFGAVGGVLGGCLAQYVYGALSAKYLIVGVAQVLLRAVGWSMMGLFFGLSLSASGSTHKRMRNGIIGGASGGLLGGIAFQLILNGVDSASLGRFLALCVVGASVGLLIGLVEEAAKDAWLRIVKGPLAGKQFILYQERTIIGGSPSCDIMLLKDPSIAPEHAQITHQLSSFVLSSVSGRPDTLVNGQPVSRRLLEDGDTISIGSSQMEFRERIGKQIS